MSILLIAIAVLGWIIYCQHREIGKLDRQLEKRSDALGATEAELLETKVKLRQLELLADHIRQYEVIGGKEGSVFSYISAFHPLRRN